MEGGPSPEVLQQNPPPDFLAIYGEQISTIEGVTATYNKLAKLCPIDLNSPDVTIEARNEFMIAAGNEGGLVIQPEHKEYVDLILEKHDQKPNYTIAEAVAPTPPKEKPEKDQTPERLVKQPKPVVEVAQPTRDELIEKQRRAVNEVFQAHVQSSAVERDIPVDIEKTVLNVAPVVAVMPTRELIVAERPDIPQVMAAKSVTIEQVPIQSVKGEAEIAPAVVAVPLEIADDQLIEVQATESSFDEVFFGEFPLSEDLAAEETDMSEIGSATNELFEYFEGQFADTEPIIDRVDWASELTKEPEALFVDFTEALFAFAENTEASTATEVSGEERLDAAPVSPIVQAVAERLTELSETEKSQAVPLVQNIIGAIHGLGLLEERGAPPQAIEAVEAQLTQICRELFDILGLVYTEDDVRQFIEVMKSPEFQPVQPSSEELSIDLEDLGTHESKWRFTQFTDGVNTIKSGLQQAIGGIALVSTSRLSS